ncbi:MAG: T9SS type A sorting domain-containing protein [Bacteroidales bacterium]|nr:T9SS type A sorting domain-containing protein [Bacteroidales bacterium]
MKRSIAFRIRDMIPVLTLLVALYPYRSLHSQDDQDKQGALTGVPRMEVVEDDYVPMDMENRQVAPAYKASAPGFFTVQVNVDQGGYNIVGDAANEPSITFNPLDHSIMVIGWRQFNTINNNFRQAGFGYTTDGGQSWTFPGVIEPGVFRSDPVLGTDRFGNFFYNSLTSSNGTYSCQVFKSEDGGATWGPAVFAQGGDKQWMSIDKSGGMGDGNIYSFWTAYYSYCYPDFFTRSVDRGASFEDCTYITGEPFWGTTVVDDNGYVYVCGVHNYDFMFALSTNAQDSTQLPTWDVISDVYLNGEIMGFGGYDCPNPSGLLGQTIITVDSSGGPHDGNIYILCSVDPYGNPDPLDVMFTRSTDTGLTWSAPIRVNDDPGNNAYQWFGTMSVAPDGRIDVVWLDTRDNPGSVWSALYYCYSNDGGVTFSVNQKLSESFNPHVGWPQQDKMGDYFDMFSDETGAHLAWAATFNGEQDVYYAHITPEVTGITSGEMTVPASLVQNYPNPFRHETHIRYHLAAEQRVSLKVFDMTGQEVATLVDKWQPAGPHQITFNASSLRAGIYYCRLATGDYEITRKLMVME